MKFPAFAYSSSCGLETYVVLYSRSIRTLMSRVLKDIVDGIGHKKNTVAILEIHTEQGGIGECQSNFNP